MNLAGPLANAQEKMLRPLLQSAEFGPSICNSAVLEGLKNKYQKASQKKKKQH